jgi:FMN phosphatase YigB (HAD superfamily)
MTRATRYRAVAFDMGGVLVDVDHQRCAHLLGLPWRVLEPAFFADGRHDALTVGALSADAFVAAAASACRRPVARVRDAWGAVVEPWAGAGALVERVARAGLVTLAWSNTDPIHVAVMARGIPFVGDAPDVSFRLGAMKPDAAFYAGALARVGLRADEVLFLDDRDDNVAAARVAGVDARVVRGGLEVTARVLHACDVLD